MTPGARRVLYLVADVGVVVAGYVVARMGVAFSVAFFALVVYALGAAWLRSPKVPVRDTGLQVRDVSGGPWARGASVPGARRPDAGEVDLTVLFGALALLVWAIAVGLVVLGIDGPAL